ncbi:ATP-binding cassette domain-containing protein [Leptothrix sp. BB-4]
MNPALALTATALPYQPPGPPPAERLQPIHRHWRHEPLILVDLQARGGPLMWRVDSAEAVRLRGLAPGDVERLADLLTGRMPPIDGGCWLGGEEIWSLAEADRRHKVQREVAVLRRSDRLRAHLSLRDNLMVPLLLHHLPPHEALTQADAALVRLGLGALADVQAAFLPGRAQRLGLLARALIHRPRVLLIDRPEHGLDDDDVSRVRDALHEAVSGHGAALLVVTEHPRLAALADGEFTWPAGAAA